MRNQTVWALPAPDPYQGSERCKSCVGAKVTGARYRFDPSGGTADRVLLADVICPDCGGCGRLRHEGCAPTEHAGWPHDLPDDSDEQKDDEQEDDEQEAACPSCDGRRWWVCQGFNESVVHDLRVACGCAEPLLVEVHPAGR